MDLNYEKDNLTKRPYDYYLKRYQEMQPYMISERLHIPYSEGENCFHICFLGEFYKVTYPDFYIMHETEENGIYLLEDFVQAKILLLRYLVDGIGMEHSGALLSYHDLPWGETYYRQFYGRCILRLAKTYGNQMRKFTAIMRGMHGCERQYGDVAYEFELLNGLNLCFILWEGDEEFAPSAQILFSDNFPAAFSAEDVAYVGDIVMEYMKQYGRRKL